LIRTKVAKAQDFLEIAELAGEAHFDAAVSLAVSAAVNASDVLCLVATGGYPTGDNHGDASGVLRKAGFPRSSTHLARVLAFKNKAQYLAIRCTERDADDAMRHARRLLDEAVNQAKAKGFLE
jgi:hypothetical protein